MVYSYSFSVIINFIKCILIIISLNEVISYRNIFSIFSIHYLNFQNILGKQRQIRDSVELILHNVVISNQVNWGIFRVMIKNHPFGVVLNSFPHQQKSMKTDKVIILTLSKFSWYPLPNEYLFNISIFS